MPLRAAFLKGDRCPEAAEALAHDVFAAKPLLPSLDEREWVQTFLLLVNQEVAHELRQLLGGLYDGVRLFVVLVQDGDRLVDVADAGAVDVHRV